MELEFTSAKWQADDAGVWLSLLTPDSRSAREFVRGHQSEQKPWVAKLSPKRRHRSLDANAYLWVLCQKIAQAVGGGQTKETVYLAAIHQAGQWEIVPVENSKVEERIRLWNARGVGDYAECLGDSKLPGYSKLIRYYGSSRYNTEQMGFLLDYVVSLARELNIETATPRELSLLKEAWP